MADFGNLNLIRTKLNILMYPYHDVTDEDLSIILYERDDLFKNFILWALSKMDVELGESLRKSRNLQRELITILHDLQITNTDEMDKFVLGGLSKEQQLNVWLRLLDAVECVSTFEEKPKEHRLDIADLIFKEKRTNLPSVHRPPSTKERIPSLEEAELLLQDAKTKLEQLENVIVHQPTMGIIYNSTMDHNMETTFTSLPEKLGEFRNILAEYDVKKPSNEAKLQQSSDDTEVISVTKIKEISDKISSANSFLSYLNTRRNVMENPDLSFEYQENLRFKEYSDEFIKVCEDIEKLIHSV